MREEARSIVGTDHADILMGPSLPTPPEHRLTTSLLGRNGQPIGRIQLWSDSTQQYTDDDESILMQLAHVAAVALENARLYEELRNIDRRKDEFLATLAHELRNPLAPIRNALQIFKLSGAESPPLRLREMMERQLLQMVRLVDDLLDVSRITRGKIDLRRERIVLAKVVETALESTRPLIEAANHDLTVTLPPEPLIVNGDLNRLAQVLSNLLNNAAKYTNDGGRIELTARRDDSHVVLCVRDTGMGIPAAMLPHIFEMFAQADRSLNRAQGGLGIGLTLVRRLVEMHGGTVEARSAGAGQGSEFVVRLPAAPSESAESGKPAAPATQPVAPAGLRVLVVDDNPDAADSLATILRMTGNQVRHGLRRPGRAGCRRRISARGRSFGYRFAPAERV